MFRRRRRERPYTIRVIMDGKEMPAYMLRAHMVVTATDYRHDARSITVTVTDQAGYAKTMSDYSP